MAKTFHQLKTIMPVNGATIKLSLMLSFLVIYLLVLPLNSSHYHFIKTQFINMFLDSQLDCNIKDD